MIELHLLNTECVGPNCFMNPFIKGYVIGVASICILLVIIELLYILSDLYNNKLEQNNKKNN